MKKDQWEQIAINGLADLNERHKMAIFSTFNATVSRPLTKQITREIEVWSFEVAIETFFNGRATESYCECYIWPSGQQSIIGQMQRAKNGDTVRVVGLLSLAGGGQIACSVVQANLQEVGCLAAAAEFKADWSGMSSINHVFKFNAD